MNLHFPMLVEHGYTQTVLSSLYSKQQVSVLGRFNWKSFVEGCISTSSTHTLECTTVQIFEMIFGPPTFITRIIISFTPWSKYMASRPQKVDKIQGLYKTIIQSMANDGGFKYFLFSSLPGGDDPIWWAHFSNGLVQSPTRWCACAIYWATPGVSFLVLDPCLFGWLATSL